MSSLMELADHSCDMSSTIPSIEGGLEYAYGALARMLRSINVRTSAATLQGCLPLLLQQGAAEKLIELAGQERYEELRSCYRELSLLNLWYSLELKQVLAALKAANIRVMVLKGADLAATVYPRPDLRYFDDIDLMVPPEDLTATVALLERLGYSYYQEYRFESISKQRAGFVYVKTVAAGYLVFEIHTSPHSNEMGVSFDTAQLWERARPITVADTATYGMGLEDLLIYLCWHYRSHIFGRLIWLYDIALLLSCCADQIDWALMRRTAHERGLAATVYYCAHLSQQVFHISLPENAQLEKCRPPVLIQRLITRFVGDDLALVLRRSGEAERKILQRLMVDNITALYIVGFRTLFPSPTHLGRLYMEHSRLPVQLFWLYYPFHPLFILKAFLRKRRKKKNSHK